MFLKKKGMDFFDICALSDGRIAAIDGEGNILLFDAESAMTLGQLTAPHSKVLALSPDGKILAAAYKVIYLFDLETDKKIDHLKGHNGEVQSMAFSPSGEFLASGSAVGLGGAETSVRIWRLSDFSQVTPPFKIYKGARGVEWLDEKTLLVVARGKLLKIDLSSNTVSEFFDFGDREVSTISVHRESGRAAVSLNPTGEIFIFDGNKPKRLKLSAFSVGREGQTIVRNSRVLWRPDGKALFVSAFISKSREEREGGLKNIYIPGPDRGIRLLEIDPEGRERSRFFIYGIFISGMTYSFDGSKVFVVKRDEEIYGYDLERGEVLKPKFAERRPLESTKKGKKSKKRVENIYIMDGLGLTNFSIDGKGTHKVRTNSKFFSLFGMLSVDESSKVGWAYEGAQGLKLHRERAFPLKLPRLSRAGSLMLDGPSVAVPQSEGVILNLDDEVLSSFDFFDGKLYPLGQWSLDEFPPLSVQNSEFSPPHFGKPKGRKDLGQLAVSDSGLFGIFFRGRLFAGTVDREKGLVTPLWSLSLPAFGPMPTRLCADGDRVSLFALDLSANTVHYLSVDSDGESRGGKFSSISLPLVRGGEVIFQPSEDTVAIARFGSILEDERRFSVGKFLKKVNSSWWEEIEGAALDPDCSLEFFSSDRRFFCLAPDKLSLFDPVSGQEFPREFSPAYSSISAKLSGFTARLNSALRPFNLWLKPASTLEKDKLYLYLETSPSNSSLSHSVPLSWVRELFFETTFPSEFHHEKSSFYSQHRWSRPEEPSTAEELLSILNWMKRVNYLPLEEKVISDYYADDYYYRSSEELPISIGFFDEEAERMWVRALLETAVAEGWEGVEPNRSWGKEPISEELASRGVSNFESLHKKLRFLGSGEDHSLLAIISYFGERAFPLLKNAFPRGENNSYLFGFFRALEAFVKNYPQQVDDVRAYLSDLLASGKVVHQIIRENSTDFLRMTSQA